MSFSWVEIRRYDHTDQVEGAILAGGIATCVYTTCGAEDIHFMAEQSDTNIIVTQDESITNRILEVSRHTSTANQSQFKGSSSPSGTAGHYPATWID